MGRKWPPTITARGEAKDITVNVQMPTGDPILIRWGKPNNMSITKSIDPNTDTAVDIFGPTDGLYLIYRVRANFDTGVVGTAVSIQVYFKDNAITDILTTATDTSVKVEWNNPILIDSNTVLRVWAKNPDTAKSHTLEVFVYMLKLA